MFRVGQTIICIKTIFGLTERERYKVLATEVIFTYPNRRECYVTVMMNNGQTGEFFASRFAPAISKYMNEEAI